MIRQDIFACRDQNFRFSVNILNATYLNPLSDNKRDLQEEPYNKCLQGCAKSRCI